MTISQVASNVSIENLTRVQAIDVIHKNQIVPISSKTEATEIYMCLKHFTPDQLQKASHIYAYELSCHFSLVQSDPRFFDYINTGLCGNYRKTYTKPRRAQLIELVFKNFSRISDKTLIDAMDFLNAEDHHNNPDEDMNELVDISLPSLRGTRMAMSVLAGILNGYISAQNITVLDQAENLKKLSLEEKNYCRDADVSLVRRVSEPSKECPDGIIETFYVENHKFDKMWKKGGEDDTCHICMEFKATRDCGNGCENNMCSKCFHMLRSKEDTNSANCPRCTKKIL